MSRNFKCCKTKEFLNYFCISCASVYHPSCLDRVSDCIKLGGYKIFCSSECQSKENIDEVEKDTLVEEIVKLKEEITAKNIHIERLKRRTEDFSQDVSEAEENYLAQLSKNSKLIADLNKEIIDLRRKNPEMEELIKNNESLSKKFQQEIQDMTDINRNMLTTIQTLEKDNEAYIIEMSKLRKQLKDQELGNTQCRKCREKQNTDKRTSTKKNSQLLIIGDNNARGCAVIIKNIANICLDTNTQYDNKKLFNENVEEAIKLSSNFTKQDFIIFLAGKGDAIKGRKIEKKQMDRLIDQCKRTNLIIVGPTFQDSRPVLNDIIQQQNFELKHYLEQKGLTTFIPAISSNRHGIIKHNTKVQLMKYIWLNFLLPSITALATKIHSPSSHKTKSDDTIHTLNETNFPTHCTTQTTEAEDDFLSKTTTTRFQKV